MITRYELWDDGAPHGLEESATGDWVKFEDHQRELHAAQSQVEGLREALQSFACQHKCGCGHPHCNRCADDKEVEKALSSPAVAMGAGSWSKELPKSQGFYLYWNGFKDSVPFLYYVHSKKGRCFVSAGQYGIESPIDCELYMGWWSPFRFPSQPKEKE